MDVYNGDIVSLVSSQLLNLMHSSMDLIKHIGIV